MKKKGHRTNNSLIFSFLVLTVGILLIVLPIMLLYETNDFVFACRFLGIFALACDLFLFPYAIKRQKTISDILSGKDLLFSYDYTQEEWNKYINHKEKVDTRSYIGIAILITIFSIIIGIIFTYATDDGIMVLYALLILSAVLWAFAILSPKIRKKLDIKMPSSVYIGRNGVLISNIYHTWNTFLTRYINAKVYDENTAIIRYRTYSGSIINIVDVELLVPATQKEEFCQAINILNKLNKK